MRNLIILSTIIVLSGCAIEPTTIIGPNGKQVYMLNCNAVIEMCYQKAGKLCSRGYDIINHTNTLSAITPHYGQYPMTINVENLTIQCK